VAVFVVVLFAYLAGDEWKLAVAINVTVYLAVFAALWVVSLIRTTFWRSINRTWRTAVHQHEDQPNIATVVLFGKGGTTHIVQRIPAREPCQAKSGIYLAIYPDEFQGAVQIGERTISSHVAGARR